MIANEILQQTLDSFGGSTESGVSFAQGSPEADIMFQKGHQINKGKSRSEETCRKISQKLKGRKLSPEHKAKVCGKCRPQIARTLADQ